MAEDFIAFGKVYNGQAQALAYGDKIKQYVNEFRQIL
jgi:hypothetical protein